MAKQSKSPKAIALQAKRLSATFARYSIPAVVVIQDEALLGRQVLTGDGRIWRVESITGRTTHDEAHLRCESGEAGDSMIALPLRLLIDALAYGLLEEV